MTTTPLGEAKNKLSELVDRAARTHERFEITVHGHTKAVLLSVEDWESLQETLDVLSDPETRANIAEAERSDETYSTEEVEAAFAARVAARKAGS
jgi:antitoxin YefM